MSHTLHILTTNFIPINIAHDSAVVLMQDAVYLLLLDKTPYTKLYVIKSDLQTRGLTVRNSNVELIDYSELVILTSQYNKIITWS
jgi:Uncharacterized conserved protein involved in oxidation of intracellular sulfur